MPAVRIFFTARETGEEIHGGLFADSDRAERSESRRSAAQTPAFYAGARLSDHADQCDARRARPLPQRVVVCLSTLAPAELARRAMPVSSTTRAPCIATARWQQCGWNAHCLRPTTSCVRRACRALRMDMYSCVRVAHDGVVVRACQRLDDNSTSVAREVKYYFFHAHSTTTLEDRPQEAAWPPTQYVRRYQSHIQRTGPTHTTGAHT